MSSVSAHASAPKARSTDEMEEEFSRMRQLNAASIEMFNSLSSLPKSKANVKEKPSPEVEAQFDAAFNDFLDHFLYRDSQKENSNTSERTSNTIMTKFPYLTLSPSDRPYSQAELFIRQMDHANTVGSLGSKPTKRYLPHEDLFRPKTVVNTSIETLLAAGVHLGHSKSLWKPATQPFIHGEYKGIHIIDLDQTLTFLKRAARVVQGCAEKGGIILFVGTRPGHSRCLELAAERCGGYFVSSRWVPGTITNFTEVSNNAWDREEVDMDDKPTKRELSPFESSKVVKPDLLVVLNPAENAIALKEAVQARIPTIGIIDTDVDPSLVTYPIPGNDDSIRGTNLIAGVLSKSGEQGRRRRLEEVKAYKQKQGMV